LIDIAKVPRGSKLPIAAALNQPYVLIAVVALSSGTVVIRLKFSAQDIGLIAGSY